VPPRCPGQPPAAPGPPRWTPTVLSCSRGAAGPAAHRAWRANLDAKTSSLFKLKLNAEATAPGTTGPRPAERLAYGCAAQRSRASAGETLASRQLSSSQLFLSARQHHWVACTIQTHCVCLPGLHSFSLHFETLEAAGAQPIGSTKTPSTRETPRHCAAAARELPAR